MPDGWVQVGGALLATFGLQYLLSATGDYARARTNRRAVLAQGRGQAPPADAPEAPAPAAAPMTAAPAAAAASQEAPGPGTTAQSGGSVAASSRQGRTAILPQPVEQVADDAGKQVGSTAADTRLTPPTNTWHGRALWRHHVVMPRAGRGATGHLACAPM